MSNPALRDFDGITEADVELDGSIDTIEAYSDELSDEQISRLFILLHGRSGEITYNASFSIKEEMEQQINMVRKMRSAILPQGQVRPGPGSRELKEVVAASSTLLSLLMKVHPQVLSMDRQRSIESAVSETTRSLSQEDQQKFLALLESNLAEIE